MLFNVGIYYMIVSNVILDKEEQEHLKEIYKKYIETPLEYDNKFFLDKQDIEFLIRIQKLAISSMLENIKLLKKNNKVFKSMLK
jgi:hypothetical protein